MSEKIYAWLLRLFPSHFRKAYGDEALQLVRDRARDERGVLPTLRLWLDLFADLARSLPREHSYFQSNLIGAVAQHRSKDVPSFRVIETELPRPGSLFFGGALTLLIVCILPTLFNQVGDDRASHVQVEPQRPVRSASAASQSPTPQTAEDTPDDIREDIKQWVKPDTGQGTRNDRSTPGETPMPAGSATSGERQPGDPKPNALETPATSRTPQLQTPRPDARDAGGTMRSTAACVPVPGADQIWSNPSLHWVLVGEVHGNNETPAAFFNLVCDALSKGKKVIAVLEHPEDEQAALDDVLTASGLEPAQTILLAQPSWKNGMDGRASEAMLDLILSLRELHRAYPGLAVVAFDVPRAAATTVAAREQGMGRTLLSLASAKPDHLFLVLTGSLHAIEEPRFGNDMAAMYLPPKQRLSLEVTYRGGQAWGRSPDGCGPMKAEAVGRELTPYGVFLNPVLAPDGKYDGILSLGRALTPSVPAAGIPFPLPPCRVKFLAQHQPPSQH